MSQTYTSSEKVVSVTIGNKTYSTAFANKYTHDGAGNIS